MPIYHIKLSRFILHLLSTVTIEFDEQQTEQQVDFTAGVHLPLEEVKGMFK